MTNESSQLTLKELARREAAGEDSFELLAEAGLSPEEIDAIRSEIQEFSRYSETISDWVRSGDPAADWAILFMPVTFPAPDGAPEADPRLAALRRILDRMPGQPIHRKRWEANRDALITACTDLGVEVEDLAEYRGWEVAREAVGRLTPGEVREASEYAMRRFRSSLSRLIRDDLLPGHDWKNSRRRSVSYEETFIDEALMDEAYSAVEARSEIEALFDRAGLSEYETQVLALDRDGHSAAEIAEELERPSAGAIYEAKRSALSKLRSAIPSD